MTNPEAWLFEPLLQVDDLYKCLLKFFDLYSVVGALARPPLARDIDTHNELTAAFFRR